MERRSPARPTKRSIGGDLLIPIAAVAFTLYYFSTILASPWEAQVNAVFVGSLLIVLVGVFLARVARDVRAGEADLGIGELIRPRGIVGRRLGLLGLTLGYLVALPWGGFTLTGFAFLFAAMSLLSQGERPRRAAVLAGALALGGYLLFIVAFETRFPAGPFERLMSAVF